MEQDEDSGEQGGLKIETIRSYISFARQAIKKRRALVVLLLLFGFSLTVGAFRYLPRTYYCHTVLMGEASHVLDGSSGASPFAGANSLIMRHDNLDALVRETDLPKKFQERRPTLLRLKDRMLERAFGAPDEETMVAILLATLEDRLDVQTDGGTLSVGVSWSDGETAAELAEAARESFIKARHSVEMSAFQQKMAILDGHATRLREEVEDLAQQVRSVQERKFAEVSRAAAGAATPAPTTGTASRFVIRRAPVAFDGDKTKMKEQLEVSKRKLADLEADHDRKVREERAKLADLKLKLAPSHPDVIATEQRVAMLAQPPSELLLLRSEVKSQESELEQRESLAKSGTMTSVRTTAPAAAAPEGAAPLPGDIMELLGQEDVDPALVAQLSGAVTKYGAVRSDLRSGRIELDTAQAAFNHRYRLIVPAEIPSSPTKPKASMILGGGLIVTLLLALLLPVLGELRTGIIVERWQVEQVRLPVLAELRLPPHSMD